MLTKRQQEALIAMRGRGFLWPSWCFAGVLGSNAYNGYFAYMTAYSAMDAGFAAFGGAHIYLTPTGERLAAILAELPAPLTRRQWGSAATVPGCGYDSDLLWSKLRIRIRSYRSVVHPCATDRGPTNGYDIAHNLYTLRLWINWL